MRKRITILILFIMLVTSVTGIFSIKISIADPTNQPPILTNVSPANNSNDLPIDTSTISVLIEDPEGDSFNWTITTSPNVGSSSDNNSHNGTKTTNLIVPLPQDTEIIWYVNVIDPGGSGKWTNVTYHFTTQSIILNQKAWSPITSGSGESRVGPSIADINNDGQMEIIRAGLNGIVVYKGATGTVLWSNLTTMWDTHIPIEIIDLNKDGFLDIISSYSTGTRALSGKDGSVLWYNPNAPLYNKHPVAGDIDTDGYPEVYVCTSGSDNGSHPGKITALTHDGTIFEQIDTYFPCYGGLTLGDTNSDGVFELFMGERNVGYHGNTIGKGVRAFWASNLTERWSHPELLSSSLPPALVDTNKDGILEVVTLDQSGHAIYVFNSATGNVIHSTGSIIRNLGVRCHSAPTIYDIDGDGNLEIIVGGGSDVWSKACVWDLYTWSLDALLPFDCWEPPAIADINGDGHVEILECTIKNISIFDHNYMFLGSIPLNNNNSGVNGSAGYYGMSMIIAQDIDNDGKLELVLNRGIHLYAYDTSGAAPTPRALTQFSYYSQMRGRSPYYTPYGPLKPLVKNEYPGNGSTNVPYNPQLSVYVYDYQYDLMTVTFRTNASTGVWHTLETHSNVHEGTYMATTTEMNTPNTSYYWSVQCFDGQYWTNQTFRFTTRFQSWSNNPPTFNSPSPVNVSTGITRYHATNITVNDLDGNSTTVCFWCSTSNSPYSWTKVQQNNSVVANTTVRDISSSYSSGWNTQYWWKVTANDGHANSSVINTFTTSSQSWSNSPPVFGTPSPQNGLTIKQLSFNWSISINDLEGDSFDWTIQCSNGQSANANGASNGTKSLFLSGLAYSTYTVWVNVTDPTGSGIYNQKWYTFARKISGGGGGGGGDETPNSSPTANFTYSPTTPTIDDTIQFTDTSSDSDGTIASWSWNFGDGTTSTSKNPQHLYTIPSQYTIVLEVTDNDGATKSISKIITISQQEHLNNHPTANFSFYPSTVKINDTIQFTDASIDTDGTISSYLWNFGDGTTSTSKNPQHRYTSNGTYSITLEITDNDGATNLTSKTILINKDSTDTNGSKGTPGFELIIVIGAITLVFLWKRKSKK